MCIDVLSRGKAGRDDDARLWVHFCEGFGERKVPVPDECHAQWFFIFPLASTKSEQRVLRRQCVWVPEERRASLFFLVHRRRRRYYSYYCSLFLRIIWTTWFLRASCEQRGFRQSRRSRERSRGEAHQTTRWNNEWRFLATLAAFGGGGFEIGVTFWTRDDDDVYYARLKSRKHNGRRRRREEEDDDDDANGRPQNGPEDASSPPQEIIARFGCGNGSGVCRRFLQNLPCNRPHGGACRYAHPDPKPTCEQWKLYGTCKRDDGKKCWYAHESLKRARRLRLHFTRAPCLG